VMGGPGWLSGAFAIVMLAVAGYCAARLIAAHRWRRPTEVDADGVHVVMGVAMAGMLATGLKSLPVPAWESVFAAAAAWFGWQAVRARRGVSLGQWRCPQPVPHLVECGAMLYMLLVIPSVVHAAAGTGGMSGMAVSAAGSRLSVLALAATVFMLGYVVWIGNRLTAPVAATGTVTDTTGGGCQPLLAPRSAGVYKIAMGVTMGYMLILLL
jgi:hypothetical protein